MANVLGNVIKKGKGGVELFVNGVKNTTAKKVNINDPELPIYNSGEYNYIDGSSDETYNFLDSKHGKVIIFKNYLFRTRVKTPDNSSTRMQLNELIPLPEDYDIEDICNAIGTEWEQPQYSLPEINANAYYHHFIVWKDELYALGGVSKSNTDSSWNIFRKLDVENRTWISKNNLPLYFSVGTEFVTDNAIHIIQGTNHYAWNGSSWNQKANLLFDISYYYTVAYRGLPFACFEQKHGNNTVIYICNTINGDYMTYDENQDVIYSKSDSIYHLQDVITNSSSLGPDIPYMNYNTNLYGAICSFNNMVIIRANVTSSNYELWYIKESNFCYKAKDSFISYPGLIFSCKNGIYLIGRMVSSNNKYKIRALKLISNEVNYE